MRIHCISNWIDGGDSILLRHLEYTTETHTVHKRNIDITINNMSPILTEQEELQQHQKIEQELYDIFIKYKEIHSKRIAK